ncbi:MAG: peptide deformylase [Clostridiales bacterium]|nr:peptide deformylase [Clostridiales bacterium]
MIKPIIRDVLFLNRKSELATENDKCVIEDLLDTLKANKERCVGMAANMIGVNKRIIVFNTGFMDMIMINPVIIKKSGAYEAEEGCLSLSGIRKTTRYKNIEVEFLDINFKRQRQKYFGEIAQIIQHETDHCDGILI